MYVLEQLWRGNITPSERFLKKGTKYRELSNRLAKRAEAFEETLSPEAKRELDEINSMRVDLHMMDEEDTFIVGFRLGAGTLLDVVSPYNSPFYTPGEE